MTADDKQPEHHLLRDWFTRAAAERQHPPKSLGSVAGMFLGDLYADREWQVVRRALEQLSRDKSIEGIVRRQEETLALIAVTAKSPDEESARKAANRRAAARRSLAKDLVAAEDEFRARVAELTDQLHLVVEEADKIPKHSPLGQAASRIARSVRQADLSSLGPYWMLIVLYWLIVHMTLGEISAIALWYAVARDVFFNKSDDDE